jgi:antitoxin component YwqK of YwqJK toxin-antitoxin module
MTTEAPKNGLHTEYYDSGQTRVELNYKDGKKRGKFTVRDKNGQIIEEHYYKNGKLID